MSKYNLIELFFSPILLMAILSFPFDSSLRGQAFQRSDYPVQVNGRVLGLPWVGGLNSPQFNKADFNNDGLEDLLVFDRAGNLALPFLNLGRNSTDTWAFSPDLLDDLPDYTNWAILKDYDGDGIKDLFAYSDIPGIDGIQVYRGIYENDKLTFERINFPENFNVLHFTLPSGSKVPLRITKIDFPAIEDMDCDGDLDILTFNLGGGQLELFKNFSVEDGFGRDSLIFRISDFCWGGIFESGFTKEVDLSPAPDACASELGGTPVVVRHAGSTILAFDKDNDGDKDLVMGDLSFDNLNLLTNGGDCQTPWVTEQEINFPANDEPAGITAFPASFLLDVDNDGIKDLLAAPNAARGVENTEVAWFYKNIQSNEQPAFSLRNKQFLVGEMLDFGERTHPAVADVNADGLLDIVVGNGGIFESFTSTRASLVLLQNTGTADEPQFELVDSNYLNLGAFSDIGLNFTPTFGDIDNDGDQDLIVGEEQGALYFAENIAGAGQPFRFAAWEYPYKNINVGIGSAPQIIDLNEDGLKDLIIGEQNGNVNYFQNIGTEKVPDYAASPNEPGNTPFFGRLDARIPGFVFGSAQPVFFEEEGQLKLLLGTENGKIEEYIVDRENPEAAFTLVDEFWGKIKQGFKTSIALADFNNDELLDVVVGNERGGLAIYATDVFSALTTSTTSIEEEEISIYPNPVAEQLTIQLSNQVKAEKWLTIYGSEGRVHLTQRMNSIREIVDLSRLESGVYFLKIHSNTGVSIKKIIKK